MHACGQASRLQRQQRQGKLMHFEAYSKTADNIMELRLRSAYYLKPEWTVHCTGLTFVTLCPLPAQPSQLYLWY